MEREIENAVKLIQWQLQSLPCTPTPEQSANSADLQLQITHQPNNCSFNSILLLLV